MKAKNSQPGKDGKKPDRKLKALNLNAYRAQVQAGLELRDEVSALAEALNRINNLKKQIATLQEVIGGEGQAQEVQATYRPVMEQARALISGKNSGTNSRLTAL